MTARPSILIVDDTVENLQLLATMLTELGYEARPVPSGKLALQAAERDPPDLVLVDINMPNMNGYEVCEKLKADSKTSQIPVIFISALTDPSDKIRAFKVGGVDYVTKPFHVAEVAARVSVHLSLRRTQRELAESYERLRSLEDLRDRLVHMVVHDMRSPLSTILMHMDLLRESLMEKIEEEDRQDLLAIEASAKRVRDLANDLLDVSRLEEGRMPVERNRCDLSEVTKRVVESLRALDKSRPFDLSLPPCELSCDPKLVERVIENLVSNAIRHTPQGSAVSISCSLDETHGRFVVRDQGEGIPRGAERRIFERFGTLATRTDRTYHSVGLGLAFSKLAVEAQGGQIGVESAPAAGTTFWFTLPRG
ncbi:MAG: hybrid sensor histidine kinase/response regulator [Polyangiaceae bacterium]